jgi:hypothetical protein
MRLLQAGNRVSSAKRKAQARVEVYLDPWMLCWSGVARGLPKSARPIAG